MLNASLNRHTGIILLSVIVLCLTGAVPARTDIYSYVDGNNVIHFTNVPTNRKYKLIFREYGSFDRTRIPQVKLQDKVERVAGKYGVDPLLIMAMIKVESDFMPHAISSAGAVGLMQLLPSTFKEMNMPDIYTPRDNIEAGVKYFKYLYTMFKGDYIKAIAAYNAGEKAVIKYNGIPPYPETQWYVAKVLKTFWKMKGYTER